MTHKGLTAERVMAGLSSFAYLFISNLFLLRVWKFPPLSISIQMNAAVSFEQNYNVYWLCKLARAARVLFKILMTNSIAHMEMFNPKKDTCVWVLSLKRCRRGIHAVEGTMKSCEEKVVTLSLFSQQTHVGCVFPFI